jgi:hypothetical protein
MRALAIVWWELMRVDPALVLIFFGAAVFWLAFIEWVVVMCHYRSPE